MKTDLKTKIEEQLKEFDILWGIAPEGSLKEKRGKEIKSFIRSLMAEDEMLKKILASQSEK